MTTTGPARKRRETGRIYPVSLPVSYFQPHVLSRRMP